MKTRQRESLGKSRFGYRVTVGLIFGMYLCAGCALERVQPETDPGLNLPDQFVESDEGGEYIAETWWKTFNDPILDRLIVEVLQTNLSLKGAIARVQEAQARVAHANSSRYPQTQPLVRVTDVDTPTNASIGKQLEDFGLKTELIQGFGVTTPDRLPITTYSFGADFAYEIDFWERSRLNMKSMEADLIATEWDYRAVRIGIIAQTIRAYVDIAYLQAIRNIVKSDIAILGERERLTQTRYQSGLKDARDLYIVKLKKWQTEAALPTLDGQQAEAEGRLWVLLGQYRSDLDEVAQEIHLPRLESTGIPIGIPADLLTQRPDIGAANHRVQAANFALGARRAELMPALSLTGTIGSLSATTQDWFNPTQWFKNVSLNLLGPILNGNRLNTNVALAEGRLNRSVMEYKRTVVTAVNEVQTVLAKLEATKQRRDFLELSVTEAQTETIVKEQRYGAGLSDYDELLAARETLNNIRTEYTTAQRDLSYGVLALHRALGGTWSHSDEETAGTEQ